MNITKTLKAHTPRCLVPLLRPLLEMFMCIRSELRLLFHSLRHGYFARAVFKRDREGLTLRQSIIEWPTAFPEFDNISKLVNWLAVHNIQYSEGRWTIYLPPQPNLKDVLGDAISFYPPNCGFKILKHPGNPNEAEYVPYAWYSIKQRFMGLPVQQVQTANLLYLLDLGTRLYDVTTFQAGSHRLTAFVVEHISGGKPSLEEYSRFMSRLRDKLETTELAILPPIEYKDTDFSPPNGHGNLVRTNDQRETVYVDFQRFFIKNPKKQIDSCLQQGKEALHFGHRYLLRGGSHLYQSVPSIRRSAKRNTETRWDLISSMLKEAGLNNLDGRLVLDIGCNAGMMMAQALEQGAAWVIGWDLPKVAIHAEWILALLGYTRYNIVATNLSENYPIMNDIPAHMFNKRDNAVVFYLTVRKYIGFMNALRDMPWKVMIYEGHEDEDRVAMMNYLLPLADSWGFSIATTALLSRDSSPRRAPLACLIRTYA